jgi:hypothetical protein
MDEGTSKKVIEALLDQIDQLKASQPGVKLPGRLGDPEMCLGTDPRADPRMIAAMVPAGFEKNQQYMDMSKMSKDELLGTCDALEKGYSGFLSAVCEGLPEIDGVEHSEEIIKGRDGNDIKLFISRPSNAAGKLPCVVHFHGGGYAILKAADVWNVRWRASLAKTGLVVVGVEYRNTAGELGAHEFPAQLHDNLSAIEWAASNQDKLGTNDTLVVNGESAGGNASLATTMKLKMEGKGGIIKGTYAMCPWICGPTIYKGEFDAPDWYHSWKENSGYFFNPGVAIGMARNINLDLSHATDPVSGIEG